MILLTIDCLRLDHLGCMGYEKDTTPSIDNLAEDGTLFTQAISNGPHTQASFPSILTSTLLFDYPFYSGGHWAYGCISDRLSVAEVLQENGFSTAGFNFNPYLSARYGYDKGFDVFFDCFGSGNKMGRIRDKIRSKLKKVVGRKSKLYRFLRKVSKPVRSKDRERDLTEEAVSWIESRDNNFFLWIHYMETHYPYDPSKRFLEEFLEEETSDEEIERLNGKCTGNNEDFSSEELREIIGMYDSCIREVDEKIGYLVEKLEEFEIFKDTILIITADDGEEFEEHGDLGHKPKFYDELLHIPLIMKGLEISSEKITRQVDLLDLSPTVCDLLDIENPTEFKGNSIFGSRERDYVVSESMEECLDKDRIKNKNGKFSCRTKKWKYIFHEDSSQEELYNLNEDPNERENVVDKNKDVAKEFSNIIDERRQKLKKQRNRISTEREKQRDEEVEKRLKKLGYLD